MKTIVPTSSGKVRRWLITIRITSAGNPIHNTRLVAISRFKSCLLAAALAINHVQEFWNPSRIYSDFPAMGYTGLMNQLADTSLVLSARSRQHHWRGSGLLSIKSFTGGSALYKIDGATFRVD